MKTKIITLIIGALAFILASCSTTRKTAQTSFEQTVTQSTTTTSDKHTEKSEALLTQSNITENLNAVIDFTRIEFNDGTTLCDLRPTIRADTAKQRDREMTEPPNSDKKHGGVKSITTGRIDLNKTKDEKTDIASTSDSKSDTSESSVTDSNTNTTQNEKTVEKERRGLFYYIGVITGAIITAFILYCIIYVVWRIRKQIKNQRPK